MPVREAELSPAGVRLAPAVCRERLVPAGGLRPPGAVVLEPGAAAEAKQAAAAAAAAAAETSRREIVMSSGCDIWQGCHVQEASWNDGRAKGGKKELKVKGLPSFKAKETASKNSQGTKEPQLFIKFFYDTFWTQNISGNKKGQLDEPFLPEQVCQPPEQLRLRGPDEDHDDEEEEEEAEGPHDDAVAVAIDAATSTNLDRLMRATT